MNAKLKLGVKTKWNMTFGLFLTKLCVFIILVVVFHGPKLFHFYLMKEYIFF